MEKSEKIKKDIVEQLYWDDRVDASDILIDVSKNVVTVRGSVPNYRLKRAALEDIWMIHGVKDVVDKLEVKLSETIPLPADNEMENNIKGVLFLNSNIDSSDIEVSVKNGEVFLEGSVDKYWKKMWVETLIENLTGVKKIANKLSVVPTESVLDKDIAAQIIGAFERTKLINVNDVDVKVKDGEVSLSGIVTNWLASRVAAELAHFTAGVIKVNNYLEIKEYEKNQAEGE